MLEVGRGWLYCDSRLRFISCLLFFLFILIAKCVSRFLKRVLMEFCVACAWMCWLRAEFDLALLTKKTPFFSG